MFKKKSAPKSFLENVDNAVHNLSEKAGQLLQEGTEAARPAIKEAGDRLQKTADNVRSQLEDWAEQGLGKIEDGLSTVEPKLPKPRGSWLHAAVNAPPTMPRRLPLVRRTPPRPFATLKPPRLLTN